ncbi:MAG: D-alanyl-D-alanine carboxypeptidase family protein [Acidimicrobiales bacterium]
MCLRVLRQSARHAADSLRRSGTRVATVGLLAVAGVAALPPAATTQSTSEELDSIRESRRAAQAERADQATQVDAATAELTAVTEALDALTVEVNAQQAALVAAERAREAAEAEEARAEAAIGDLEDELDRLQAQVSQRAIASFVNQGESPSLFVTVDNPMDAVRMQSLVEEVSGDDADLREELRGVEEDLDIERAAALAARSEAERLEAEEADRLVALEAAEAAQQSLMEEAAERLDHMLADLADLEAIESDLVARETEAIALLAAELAARGPISTNPIPIPPESEIVTVRGYRVHQSIAQNVADMIDHAARDGIHFGGWGWRDPATQVRLRREHCGTSDYEIYEMPSYLCNPPTARPGASMHERGLALDLTVNGRAISHQQTAAFRWLDANAAAYGLFNLPSEPWHWSTNGH